MMDEFTLSQSQKLAAFSLPPLNSLQLGFVSFSKPTQVCKRLAFIRFLSPLLKGLIKGAPHIIKQSAPHDCDNFIKPSDIYSNTPRYAPPRYAYPEDTPL